MSKLRPGNGKSGLRGRQEHHEGNEEDEEEEEEDGAKAVAMSPGRLVMGRNKEDW